MPLSNSRKVSTKGLSTVWDLRDFQPALRYLWRVHIQSSLRRGYASAITPHQFKAMIEGNCHYCGIAPTNKTKLRNVANIAYNGLDRVDQSKPYEIDNLVSCCKTCNSMKSRLLPEKFLSHVALISKHQAR